MRKAQYSRCSFSAALLKSALAVVLCLSGVNVQAQEVLPVDNGIPSVSGYHNSPRYRDSESHPLRVAGYILHPVGWLLREGIFRPLSYFASSSETTRSVMGYRDQYDFRNPECFFDDPTPDCRQVVPFNYDPDARVKREGMPAAGLNQIPESQRQIFFPNINFDFNKRALSPLGKSQARQVAEMIKTQPGDLKIVLQGHTDKRGTETYNSKLGLDRALAVRAELVALGVDANRMSTISFGESQPLDSSDTEDAYAANRRVETKVQ